MVVRDGYKMTEVGVIPEAWEVVKLSTIATVTSGKRLPAGYYVTERASQHPYIRVADMNMGWLSTDKIKYLPPGAADAITKYRIYKDDLYISVAGTLGLVGPIPNSLDGANLTENANRISSILVDREYLLFILLHDTIQQIIKSEATLGAQPKLALKRIRSFPIPLPPTKKEQRRIAAALGDADGWIRSLEALLAKKRLVKAGVMEELLRPGVGWRRVRLGECLSQEPSYGINAASVPYRGDLPTYLRITDITENGSFRVDGRVSVDHSDSENYHLSAGDIVFARTGASVGKTYYHNDNSELVYAGFLIKMTTDVTLLSPKYLFYWTQTNEYKNWVIVNSVRSGQPGINASEYSTMELDLPPLSRQTQIAKTLSTLDAELQTLQSKLTKARALKAAMMGDLLTGRVRLV